MAIAVLENILRRDRSIIFSGIVLISLLAWTYILYLNQQMSSMNMQALFVAMPMSSQWGPADFILTFMMWSVMMIAMMTPSAAPHLLIFAMVSRNQQRRQPYVSTAYFLIGYLLVWIGFSLLATSLQWYLQYLDFLSPEMKTTNHLLGGIILILAGIFQFTPLKRTCLHHCRTPIDFMHRHWKQTSGGAVQMGISHGIYCMGCCWILMALLFVAGIMNLFWVALIALFILIEKITPFQKVISFTAGILLLAYGIFECSNGLW